MAFLFRENRRHGTDWRTDGRSATVNAVPMAVRVMKHWHSCTAVISSLGTPVILDLLVKVDVNKKCRNRLVLTVINISTKWSFYVFSSSVTHATDRRTDGQTAGASLNAASYGGSAHNEPGSINKTVAVYVSPVTYIVLINCGLWEPSPSHPILV